jgi:hypothetical protein
VRRILLVSYYETPVEIRMTDLKSVGLEPLTLSNLWNLRSLEITQSCSLLYDYMKEKNNFVSISGMLESLPYLQNLTLFGF